MSLINAKSEKGRGKRAGFAKLLEQLASAIAKNIPRTPLTRARGLLAETIRNAQTNGRQRPRRPQCAQNTDTRVGVRSRKRVVSARQAAFGP